jgi:inhibitor of KinA sporulation pathway (predicted exonuclease)
MGYRMAGRYRCTAAGEPGAGRLGEQSRASAGTAFSLRPERSTVSPCCSRLTGLTQADVESGISFDGACGSLAALHATGGRPWASWGDYGCKQFLRQCEAASTDYPFGRRHISAQAVFAAAFNLPRPVGMARALDIAGLPLEGRHHRGDDDAWNIAALVLHLAEEGRIKDVPVRPPIQDPLRTAPYGRVSMRQPGA